MAGDPPRTNTEGSTPANTGGVPCVRSVIFDRAKHEVASGTPAAPVLHPALLVKVSKYVLPSIDRKACGGIGRSGGAGTAPGPPSQGKRDNA